MREEDTEGEDEEVVDIKERKRPKFIVQFLALLPFMSRRQRDLRLKQSETAVKAY